MKGLLEEPNGEVNYPCKFAFTRRSTPYRAEFQPNALPKKYMEEQRKMNINKILIAVLAFSLSVISAFGQRGGSRGDTVSGRNNSGIGSVGFGSPNWSEGTTRNPNAQLAFNEKLADKLKTLLPEGTDPHAASKGFGGLREFVAAVRAANNLNIPFTDLKHKMGDGSAKELQKAIHELKPDADQKAEFKKASEQAKQDIKESKRS
jgi:hypothetical protein